MERYEAHNDTDDGVWILDTQTKNVVTIFQAIDLLNAHDGMMTREQVKDRLKKVELDMDKPFLDDFEKGCLHGEESAYETVLNGGAK